MSNRTDHPGIDEKTWDFMSPAQKQHYTELCKKAGCDKGGPDSIPETSVPGLGFGMLLFWYAVFSLPGLFMALYDSLGTGGCLITGFVLAAVGTIWRGALGGASTWIRDTPAAIGLIMMVNAILGGLLSFGVMAVLCVIYIIGYLVMLYGIKKS